MQGRMQTGWRACCDENAGLQERIWLPGGFAGRLQADVRTRKPAKPHKQGVCGLRMGFLQTFATVTAVMKGDRIFFLLKTFSISQCMLENPVSL